MKARRPLTYYEQIINLPKTLNIILLSAVGGGIPILGVLLYFNATNEVLLSTIALIMFSILLLYTNKLGYHKFAGFGTFLSISGVLTYNLVFYNGLYDVSLLAFPAIIAFSCLLLGYKFVVPITATILTIISIIYKFSIDGIITPYDGRIETQSQVFWTLIAAILISGSLVYIIMSIINKNIKKTLRSEKRLKHIYEITLNGWAKALELRDHETKGHSERVTQLTLILAKKMDVPTDELKFIRWGALLHDIGKMGIPDKILLKLGQLTKEEFEQIKKHPLTAKKLFKNIPYLTPALTIPQYHHEKWDGSGYPYGLAGEEIPLPARIFAIIDVWDALLSERPYKKAWAKEKAIDHIKKNSGSHFDPHIVNTFLDIVQH